MANFGGISTTPQGAPADVTVSKTECSRQPSVRLNVKAWNDKGSTTKASFCRFLSLSAVNLCLGGFDCEGSPELSFIPKCTHGINRSTGGHEYWKVSGEILRPFQD